MGPDEQVRQEPANEPGRPRPPSKNSRSMVIGTIAGVIVLAGLIFMATRLLGGDETAPLDGSGTASQTKSQAGKTQPQPQDQPQQQAGDGLLQLNIRNIDWDAEVSPELYGGRVEDVLYEDFTGDGTEEAIVPVRQEGTESYLDYYIYSADGGMLSVLYSDFDLPRGTISLGEIPLSFIVEEAVYAQGDPDCCPSQIRRTSYQWDRGTKVFTAISVAVMKGSTS